MEKESSTVEEDIKKENKSQKAVKRRGRFFTLKTRTSINKYDNGDFDIIMPKQFYDKFYNDECLLRLDYDYELYHGIYYLKNSLDETNLFFKTSELIPKLNQFAFLSEPIKLETEAGIFINRKELVKNSIWNLTIEKVDSVKIRLCFRHKELVRKAKQRKKKEDVES